MQGNDNIDRTYRFYRAIIKEAERQKSEIAAKQHKTMEAELRQAERDARNEYRDYVRDSVSAIKTASGRHVSEEIAQMKKSLIDHRDSVYREIIDAVRERLLQFTASEEYLQFLKTSAAALETEMGTGLTVSICQRDFDRKDEISALFTDAKICIDERIQIGGFCAQNAQGSLRADDTLDLRLSAQTEWFMRNSGLTIS